jgi:hypothetical protein
MKMTSLFLSIGLATGLVSVGYAEEATQTSSEISKIAKKRNAEVAQPKNGPQGNVRPPVGQQPKPLPPVGNAPPVALNPSALPTKPLAPPTPLASPKLMPVPVLAFTAGDDQAHYHATDADSA